MTPEPEEEAEVDEEEDEVDDSVPGDGAESHVNDHAYADPGEVVEIQAPPEQIRYICVKFVYTRQITSIEQKNGRIQTQEQKI
jgi:hypothetical protein